jgi:predicted transcriptional regulator
MMWENGGFDMRTVTLGLSSRQKINKRLIEAFQGKSQGEFISFESPALLFKVLSGKRWELLKIMTGLGRDVKAVHGDVQVLLNVGILHKNDKGQIEFPFDILHVDFMLQAA